MVETELPYFCAVDLAAVLKGINEEVDLLQVKGVVEERLLGIVDDCVEFGTGVCFLVIQLLDFAVER